MTTRRRSPRLSSLEDYLDTCRASQEAHAARVSRVRQHDPIYTGPEPDEGDTGRCDICGEPYDVNDGRASLSDIGEFWDPEIDDSLIAHAQCGISAGLEQA